MKNFSHHHATIFIPPKIAAPIEQLRGEWDAVMSEQIAAHVTLCYPQEAPTINLLVERLRETCSRTTPFRLRLSEIACFETPEKGVYVEVADVDGGFERMRQELLQPPFVAYSLVPHATIVHPRTSARGREFWQQTARQLPEAEFWVREAAITAFDGAKWETVCSFLLRQIE